MQASLRFLLLGILAVNALPSNNRQKDPKLVDGDPTLPAARRQLGENGGRLSLPLIRRRNKALLNEEEHGEWAQRQVQSLRAKYDVDGLHERATGTARLVNHNVDATYYASIGIGTPPVAYNVILDTGSSDLWVAGKSCSIGCVNIKKFDSNSSSTFQSIPASFEIRYGSATATGTLGRDVVQMAGYEVQNQRFAVVDAVYASYSTLLSSPVSGLMGLAFQDIAASGGNPFWLNLANAGVWDKPMMSFCLTDLVGTNATVDEQGGVFTMGGIDESMFSGEIDYVPLPISPNTYWELPVTNMAVNGNHLSLPTDSGSYAAIDTGTSLIGAPSDVIDQMIAQTHGAFQGSGQYTDYFLYPCNETITMTISFGSRTWGISAEDFELHRLSNGTCLSSFFRVTMSSSAPKWIIGDTFLKNVYSVFRYDPPSIGFANLSATALALNTVGATLPTPTLGASIFVTAAVVNRGDSSIVTPSCILMLALYMVLVFMTSHY